ncbi:hypothetical protein [Mixta mediterraneensis]|uniref:hypothetical protein n=1 Tax=Mixta mediterraneensis TaxID=2758443 RepID=UPI001873E174|nr:hypothetical protein [Mixta mediterraneensis]MBE5251835.1 hypothetical protein [Mixta mediterraneensis]
MADVLEWPGPNPSSLDWHLESNTKTFRSPFNGSSQTARFPGSRWKCTVEYSVLDENQARKIEAVIAALDGEYGRVRIRDWGRDGKAPAGNPQVSDPEQTGTTLTTSGWTANTLVMKAGDYFTVNSELKKVTADVTSDASGVAAITFAPMLRSSPDANSPLEVQSPWGIFKLADNSQGVFKRSPGLISSTTIEFEEAF